MGVALFSYRRGTTPMHKLNALIKLPLLMILCVCTFSNAPYQIIRTSICFVICVLEFILAGARFKSIRQLSFVPLLGGLVTLFGTLCFPPELLGMEKETGIITVLPFLALNIDGLKSGILYTARFFTTALAAQTVFETTSSIQISDALESVQNIIAKILPVIKKWNPALIISLAISFIPQVFDTWNQVHIASRARSNTNKKKKLIKIINTIFLEMQSLFSCLLYKAETKRKAVQNRSMR